MPVTVSYPGVYVEEIPSGVHTITGVATSIGAFVDYFPAGPMNKAVQILSPSSFNKQFGGSDPSGLDARSEASYAIQQFFLNGGTEAYVVRVGSATGNNAPTKASVGIGDGTGASALVVAAQSEGLWGTNVRVEIDYGTTDPTKYFNLTAIEFVTVNGVTSLVATESYINLMVDSTKPNDVAAVVNAASQLIWIFNGVTGKLPAATGTSSLALPASFAALALAVADTCDVGLNGTKVGSLLLPSTLPTSYSALAALLQSQMRGFTNNPLPNATVSLVGTISTELFLVAEAGTSPSADYLTISDGGAGLAKKLSFTPAGANVQQYTLGGATVQQQVGLGTGAAGSDGTWDPAGDATGVTTAIKGDPTAKSGIYALYDVDLFNLLCLPVTANLPDSNAATVASFAEKLCKDRRAFYILDIPQNSANRDSVTAVMDWLGANGNLRSRDASVYFPRIAIPDPLNNYRLRPTPPSGTMAGLYAATDGGPGVWKAPAGTEVVLSGVQQLQYNLTNNENGVLNPLAINCLRNFPVYGTVSWGARTLNGADQMADDYKYIPVRRTALFIEESLYRGTQWVVFQPNDEPLWAQIRLNVGAFMHDLFRKGAFQGKSPKEAYFVKCDSETTPQDQINLGIVNILVGFAPVKPAEFVIIQLQQIAGQIDT